MCQPQIAPLEKLLPLSLPLVHQWRRQLYRAMVFDNKNGPKREWPGVKQRLFNATVNGSLKAGETEQGRILRPTEDNLFCSLHLHRSIVLVKSTRS